MNKETLLKIKEMSIKYRKAYAYPILLEPVHIHDCEYCKWLYSKQVILEHGIFFADFYIHERGEKELQNYEIIMRLSSDLPDYYCCGLWQFGRINDYPNSHCVSHQLCSQAAIIYLQSKINNEEPIITFLKNNSSIIPSHEEVIMNEQFKEDWRKQNES